METGTWERMTLPVEITGEGKSKRKLLGKGIYVGA
jgi:hypothetical protein